MDYEGGVGAGIGDSALEGGFFGEVEFGGGLVVLAAIGGGEEAVDSWGAGFADEGAF